MCREGAWDELAVRVTSGIAIRSGMLIKKSCRTDNDCLLYTAFLFKKIFLSQSELRLQLLQVVSSNKYFSVGVQSPTEINAPRECAVILKRRCQLALTRITHQVSRAFDLNCPLVQLFIDIKKFFGKSQHIGSIGISLSCFCFGICFLIDGVLNLCFDTRNTFI